MSSLYISTVQGVRDVTALCEHCRESCSYRAVRRCSGSGSNQELAKRRAATELQKQLDRAVESFACYSCGAINNIAIAHRRLNWHLHSARLRLPLYTAVATGILAVVGVLIVNTSAELPLLKWWPIACALVFVPACGASIRRLRLIYFSQPEITPDKFGTAGVMASTSVANSNPGDLQTGPIV